MPTVKTCLWFADRAEEAARFYASVVPDARAGETLPSPAGTPGVPEGTALVVEFTLAGQAFQLLNGGPAFEQTPAASIVLECETQAEADHYWDVLVEGGQEGQCGWLRDRFGVWWQIVPLEAVALLTDPSTSAAANAAMQMSRIDVAAMARAAGR